jgi:hypothetical protein
VFISAADLVRCILHTVHFCEADNHACFRARQEVVYVLIISQLVQDRCIAKRFVNKTVMFIYCILVHIIIFCTWIVLQPTCCTAGRLSLN